MTFDHFISTTAKQEQCPRCHKQIWRAVIDGFTHKLDPTPLDATKEVLLRMQNRRIFQTRQNENGFVLEKRSAWHITKGDPKAKVLAEHSCEGDDAGVIVDLYPTPEPKEPNF